MPKPSLADNTTELRKQLQSAPFYRTQVSLWSVRFVLDACGAHWPGVKRRLEMLHGPESHLGLEGCSCRAEWSWTAHSFWEVMLHTKGCRGYLLWGLYSITSCSNNMLLLWMTSMTQLLGVFWGWIYLFSQFGTNMCVCGTNCTRTHWHTNNPLFPFPAPCALNILAVAAGCQQGVEGVARGWEVPAVGRQGGWWGFGSYICPCGLHGNEWQWERSTLETGVGG